jgi:hypothetical protein
VNDERRREETESARGPQMFRVKPSERFHRLRTVLITAAILVPLLVAGVVFYSLTRGRSVNNAPEPTPQGISQPPQKTIIEEKPNELKVQPQPSRPTPAQSRYSKGTGNLSLRASQLSKRRADEEALQSSPVTRTDKQLVTPPQTIEIPVAPTAAPVPVDTTRIAQTAGAGSSVPAGPNKVTVRVYIDADGKPLRAEIISSTNPSYNSVAIGAAMKSTFAAGRPRTVVTGFIYP